MGLGLGGAAAGVLGVEFCVPILLLCWFCCWPEDDQSDSSSNGKPPKKPIIVNESSRRRSSELFHRRGHSSHMSLHLPSTSGTSREPLSSHRSHEEIRLRARRETEASDAADARYCSAPSVIQEVLHRRDWERSTHELRGDVTIIPLRDVTTTSTLDIRASPRTCKKHHTNTKSSRNKELRRQEEDVKDTDASETAFYIGDHDRAGELHINPETSRQTQDSFKKSLYHAKEAKQSFNESVKSKTSSSKKRPDKETSVAESWRDEMDKTIARTWKIAEIDQDVVKTWKVSIDAMGKPFKDGEELDRSGAMHRVESRESLTTCTSRLDEPRHSIEPVGYESSTCYLQDSPAAPAPLPPLPTGAAGGGRHASDGDILAAAPRPESGAFSETDVELERAAQSPAAVYCRPQIQPNFEELTSKLQLYCSPVKGRKETAI